MPETSSIEGPPIQSEFSKEVQSFLDRMKKERLPDAGASKEAAEAFVQEELNTIKLHTDAIRAANQVLDKKTVQKLATRDNRPAIVRATPTAEELSKELEETYGVVLETDTLATDLEAAQLRIAEAEAGQELEKLAADGEVDATSITELSQENHAAHFAEKHDPKIATEKPSEEDRFVWKQMLKEMPEATRSVLKDMRKQIVRVVGMKNEDLAQVLDDMKEAAIEFAKDQWIRDLPEDKRLIAEKNIQAYFETLVSGKGVGATSA